MIITTSIPKYRGDVTAFYNNLLEFVLSDYPRDTDDPRTISFVCHPMSATDFGTERRNIVRLSTIIHHLSTRTDTLCINQVPYFARFLEDDPQDFDAKFQIFYNGLIDRADQVLVAPGYQHSTGCRKEIEYARSVGKPVYLLTPPTLAYEDDDLEWVDEDSLWLLQAIICRNLCPSQPVRPWRKHVQALSK